MRNFIRMVIAGGVGGVAGGSFAYFQGWGDHAQIACAFLGGALMGIVVRWKSR